MATYTPSSPVDHVGHGHKPPAPPATGGGDDGRGGGDIPNYGARLRRARLGLVCGIATVCMVFISLTSAYIVRQGLPTFDGASNSYVRDWGRVDLPWLLLAINTAVLLVSSVTMEFARRKAARQAAAGSGEVDPGNFAGEREDHFRGLAITVLLGLDFLLGSGWPGASCTLADFMWIRIPAVRLCFC